MTSFVCLVQPLLRNLFYISCFIRARKFRYFLMMLAEWWWGKFCIWFSNSRIQWSVCSSGTIEIYRVFSLFTFFFAYQLPITFVLSQQKNPFISFGTFLCACKIPSMHKQKKSFRINSCIGWESLSTKFLFMFRKTSSKKQQNWRMFCVFSELSSPKR